LLEIMHLSAYYGDMQVLFDVSLEVRRGEVVTIVGANGAGKTSLLRSISGVMPEVEGEISFEGEPIRRLASYEIVDRGIVHVPEARQLFPFMSVADNLRLGAFSSRARPHVRDSLEYVYEFLPILKERSKQLAGSLSGGEQQMCAVGRGLMAQPKLLMLDEPSLGLAPILVRRTFDVIQEIRELGTTILLVEQNVQHALRLSDRAYVLENGRIVLSGGGQELLRDERVCQAYLGM
jgi:branched-chain amino acid transport system ATP-binding protein